jgi:hypothetical protein
VPPDPNDGTLTEWASHIRAFVSMLVGMQTKYGDIGKEQAQASMAMMGIMSGFMAWQRIIKVGVITASVLCVANIILFFALVNQINALRALLPR